MSKIVKIKDERTRVYAACIYPESMPEDWKDYLLNLHVKGFVSPLHDSDTLPDGELKKPHYHLMLMFDGPKSEDQYYKIVSYLGVTSEHREEIGSTAGYARYLCHLDNPEKHQYNIDDIFSFGGADWFEVSARLTQDLEVLGSMIEFLEEYEVTSFSDFARWTSKNNREWFRLLACKFSVFVREYIKSSTYTNKLDRVESSEI